MFSHRRFNLQSRPGPFRNLFPYLFAVVIAMLPFATTLRAQVTTGSLSGTVTAANDGSALPGVTVEAVHVPTGTRYTAVTGGNGRYTIPNVRVGGPYRITGSLDGFQTNGANPVDVALGTTMEAPFTLKLARLAEAITVTADADDIINPNHTGSTSTVSTEQIESLPTVNRSLQDFARTNPYFNVENWDESSTRMSVAGRNNRYNNIQIDGAVNNDVFGLAASGTPGGQANTQPISIDAIKQLQLVVSPYDVRQGGFTGGGLNAVTRSGTNDLSGSVFGSRRDPQFVGKGPFDREINDFNSDQYGGRLGGRIIRDRMFFFLSGEYNRREEPTGVSADGTTGTVYNGGSSPSLPAANLVRDFLISKYNYDPGSLGDFPQKTDSNLFFGRLDFNVGNSNQLTLRHNYVDAVRDVVADRSTTRFRFPTATYGQADKTNSTVGQLNSIFTSSLVNEARIGFQTIRDIRNTPVQFPSVEIGGTGARNGAINIGTERFSGANALDQDVLEITDDLTWVKGNHTVVLGTHNELYTFKNLFLSEFNGYYYYPTLDAFQADKAREYRISFATGADPRRAPEFDIAQYGLYVNDSWRTSDSLTLSFGLRADAPRFQDHPTFNPIIDTAIGFKTSDVPSEDVVWSPRLGFNWAPSFGGRQQLRGGVGIFSGRTPYVWISNAFAGSGVESIALSCITNTNPALNCTPPAFNPDPAAQPRKIGSGAALSVDLIDPDFEFPRVLRGTLGYDRDLFWGVRGTVEALYSQTQKDVFYYNVNRVQNGTSALDGRPKYTRLNTSINDAVLLSNTDKGDDTTYSVQLSRPFARGLTLSGAYAHQNTTTAYDATSSRAVSNFQFRPTRGDIFAQETYRGQFQVRNRFNVAATFDIPTGPFAHSFGLFYNAQGGHPYSLLIGGDPNTDGFTSNDLLFVPGSRTAIILCPSNAGAPAAGRPCGGTAAAPTAQSDPNRFFDFLASAGIDPTSGSILKANSLTEPMSRELDFHYGLGLPSLAGARAEIQLDVLNLLNAFDKDSGKVKSVINQTYTPVRYLGQDAASGKPIYREETSTSLNPGRQFSVADLRSRWQAKVGLRVSF